MVTLLSDPDGSVTGRAFRVPQTQVDAVLQRLDVREKGGYKRDEVSLVDLDGAFFTQALTYRATPENRERTACRTRDTCIPFAEAMQSLLQC